VELERFRLARAGEDRDGTRVGLSSEHRSSPAFGMRAALAATRFQPDGWTPATGELHAIITPSDRLRIDAAAARVLVTDNFAMLDNRVAGAFASLGGDLRLSNAAYLVTGGDVTRWSEGNVRIRIRVAPRQQLEGRPRLTLELPTLVQLYDEPMPFAFFSPERYVETGPGANAYLRFHRHWNVSAYGRVGTQRETGRSWDPFGTIRLELWRDPADGWIMRAAAAWSNSDLAGTAGFRRTSVELALTRSF
jgi:hypothetical protein